MNLLDLLRRLFRRPAPAPAPMEPDNPVAALNAARAARRLSPLREDARLDRAALRHAQDLARRGYLDHVGGDGSFFTGRILAEGYRYREAGENVGRGYGTAAAAVEGWLGSPGHRENVLGRQFRDAGMAYADGPRGRFWCAVFASLLD